MNALSIWHNIVLRVAASATSPAEHTEMMNSISSVYLCLQDHHASFLCYEANIYQNFLPYYERFALALQQYFGYKIDISIDYMTFDQISSLVKEGFAFSCAFIEDTSSSLNTSHDNANESNTAHFGSHNNQSDYYGYESIHNDLDFATQNSLEIVPNEQYSTSHESAISNYEQDPTFNAPNNAFYQDDNLGINSSNFSPDPDFTETVNSSAEFSAIPPALNNANSNDHERNFDYAHYHQKTYEQDHQHELEFQQDLNQEAMNFYADEFDNSSVGYANESDMILAPQSISDLLELETQTKNAEREIRSERMYSASVLSSNSLDVGNPFSYNPNFDLDQSFDPFDEFSGFEYEEDDYDDSAEDESDDETLFFKDVLLEEKKPEVSANANTTTINDTVVSVVADDFVSNDETTKNHPYVDSIGENLDSNLDANTEDSIGANTIASLDHSFNDLNSNNDALNDKNEFGDSIHSDVIDSHVGFNDSFGAFAAPTVQDATSQHALIASYEQNSDVIDKASVSSNDSDTVIANVDANSHLSQQNIIPIVRDNYSANSVAISEQSSFVDSADYSVSASETAQHTVDRAVVVDAPVAFDAPLAVEDNAALGSASFGSPSIGSSVEKPLASSSDGAAAHIFDLYEAPANNTYSEDHIAYENAAQDLEQAFFDALNSKHHEEDLVYSNLFTENAIAPDSNESISFNVLENSKSSFNEAKVVISDSEPALAPTLEPAHAQALSPAIAPTLEPEHAQASAAAIAPAPVLSPADFHKAISEQMDQFFVRCNEINLKMFNLVNEITERNQQSLFKVINLHQQFMQEQIASLAQQMTVFYSALTNQNMHGTHSGSNAFNLESAPQSSALSDEDFAKDFILGNLESDPPLDMIKDWYDSFDCSQVNLDATSSEDGRIACAQKSSKASHSVFELNASLSDSLSVDVAAPASKIVDEDLFAKEDRHQTSFVQDKYAILQQESNTEKDSNNYLGNSSPDQSKKSQYSSDELLFDNSISLSGPALVDKNGSSVAQDYVIDADDLGFNNTNENIISAQKTNAKNITGTALFNEHDPHCVSNNEDNKANTFSDSSKETSLEGCLPANADVLLAGTVIISSDLDPSRKDFEDLNASAKHSANLSSSHSGLVSDNVVLIQNVATNALLSSIVESNDLSENMADDISSDELSKVVQQHDDDDAVALVYDDTGETKNFSKVDVDVSVGADTEAFADLDLDLEQEQVLSLDIDNITVPSTSALDSIEDKLCGYAPWFGNEYELESKKIFKTPDTAISRQDALYSIISQRDTKVALSSNDPEVDIYIAGQGEDPFAYTEDKFNPTINARVEGYVSPYHNCANPRKHFALPEEIVDGVNIEPVTIIPDINNSNFNEALRLIPQSACVYDFSQNTSGYNLSKLYEKLTHKNVQNLNKRERAVLDIISSQFTLDLTKQQRSHAYSNYYSEWHFNTERAFVEFIAIELNVCRPYTASYLDPIFSNHAYEPSFAVLEESLDNEEIALLKSHLNKNVISSKFGYGLSQVVKLYNDIKSCPEYVLDDHGNEVIESDSEIALRYGITENIRLHAVAKNRFTALKQLTHIKNVYESELAAFENEFLQKHSNFFSITAPNEFKSEIAKKRRLLELKQNELTVQKRVNDETSLFNNMQQWTQNVFSVMLMREQVRLQADHYSKSDTNALLELDNGVLVDAASFNLGHYAQFSQSLIAEKAHKLYNSVERVEFQIKEESICHPNRDYSQYIKCFDAPKAAPYNLFAFTHSLESFRNIAFNDREALKKIYANQDRIISERYDSALYKKDLLVCQAKEEALSKLSSDDLMVHMECDNLYAGNVLKQVSLLDKNHADSDLNILVSDDKDLEHALEIILSKAKDLANSENKKNFFAENHMALIDIKDAKTFSAFDNNIDQMNIDSFNRAISEDSLRSNQDQTNDGNEGSQNVLSVQNNGYLPVDSQFATNDALIAKQDIVTNESNFIDAQDELQETSSIAFNYDVISSNAFKVANYNYSKLNVNDSLCEFNARDLSASEKLSKTNYALDFSAAVSLIRQDKSSDLYKGPSCFVGARGLILPATLATSFYEELSVVSNIYEQYISGFNKVEEFYPYKNKVAPYFRGATPLSNAFNLDAISASAVVINSPAHKLWVPSIKEVPFIKRRCSSNPVIELDFSRFGTVEGLNNDELKLLHTSAYSFIREQIILCVSSKEAIKDIVASYVRMSSYYLGVSTNAIIKLIFDNPNIPYILRPLAFAPVCMDLSLYPFANTLFTAVAFSENGSFMDGTPLDYISPSILEYQGNPISIMEARAYDEIVHLKMLCLDWAQLYIPSTNAGLAIASLQVFANGIGADCFVSSKEQFDSNIEKVKSYFARIYEQFNKYVQKEYSLIEANALSDYYNEVNTPLKAPLITPNDFAKLITNFCKGVAPDLVNIKGDGKVLNTTQNPFLFYSHDYDGSNFELVDLDLMQQNTAMSRASSDMIVQSKLNMQHALYDQKLNQESYQKLSQVESNHQQAIGNSWHDDQAMSSVSSKRFSDRYGAFNGVNISNHLTHNAALIPSHKVMGASGSFIDIAHDVPTVIRSNKATELEMNNYHEVIQSNSQSNSETLVKTNISSKVITNNEVTNIAIAPAQEYTPIRPDMLKSYKDQSHDFNKNELKDYQQAESNQSLVNESLDSNFVSNDTVKKRGRKSLKKGLSAFTYKRPLWATFGLEPGTVVDENAAENFEGSLVHLSTNNDGGMFTENMICLGSNTESVDNNVNIIGRNEISSNKSFAQFYTNDVSNILIDEMRNQAQALAMGQCFNTKLPAFYIHGPNSSGKTHLAMSVINHALALNPKLRVCYINASDFRNNYINLINSKEDVDKSIDENGPSIKALRMAFKENFTNRHILVVEDLDESVRGDRVRGVFCEIMDAYLNQSNCMLIITSRCKPDEVLANSPDTLFRERCGSLMQIALQKPNNEMLAHIIDREASMYGLQLAPQMKWVLKANIQSPSVVANVIRTLAIYCKKSPIDSIETAALVLQGQLKLNLPPASQFDVEMVKEYIADAYGITANTLCSSSKTSLITYARAMAMTILFAVVGISYAEISRAFLKDHSSVIDAVNRMQGHINSSLAAVEVFERHLFNLTHDRKYSSNRVDMIEDKSQKEFKSFAKSLSQKRKPKNKQI